MEISNTVKAAALAAALSFTPEEALPQSPVNREIALKEFKIIDKDEDYKLSTIEYLDFVAAQSLNPIDMKNKINAALLKFNSADKNKDGELNIDEYTELKENKTPVKTVTPVISKPKIDKVKSEQEAHEIAETILSVSECGHSIWNNNYQKDLQTGMNAINKIDYSNVAEVISTITPGGPGYLIVIKEIRKLLKKEYPENTKLQNRTINRLYSLLEARARDNNCLNKFNKLKNETRYNEDTNMLNIAKMILEAEEH